MKYGEKIRTVYDVSHVTPQLDNFLETCNEIGVKRLTGADRGMHCLAHEKITQSEYEYISTSQISSNRKLRIPLKEIAKLLNVYNHMLTHSLLQLQPSDFLGWQDYYMWQKRIRVIPGCTIGGSITNFFSISLTEGNKVEFKDEIIDVPIYHGIVFHPADVHRIPQVSNKHTWLVFGIPYHLDVGQLLEQA